MCVFSTIDNQTSSGKQRVALQFTGWFLTRPTGIVAELLVDRGLFLLLSWLSG